MRDTADIQLSPSPPRTVRSGRPTRQFLTRAVVLAALLAGLVTSTVAAQDEQVLTLLRGETGIDPEPGTLLATVSGLSIHRAPLAEALVRLAERSRVQIAFSPSLFPSSLRVSCDCTKLNLARTLDRLLADTQLGYVEMGSQVVILPLSDKEGVLKGSLSGRVRSELAVPLADATVRLLRASDETDDRVTGTDRLGYFSLHDLPPGDFVLTVALIGYATHERTIAVASDTETRMDVTLSRKAVPLEEVLVEAPRTRQRAAFEESAGVTVQELDLAALQTLPGVAAGDPIRALDVLPGVTRVSDVAASYNVRGGSGDQNLVLLDDIPIFHPFHLLGAFSVFNPDMVERAELKSGGFPAEHGGRVSSVLSVESNPGDGDLGADAAVSLLDSRIAVRGGLSSGMADALGLGAGRWRVSARRSYWDVLFKLGRDALFPYSMTDFQAAFEGWTKRGNRIRVNAYSGRDRVKLRDLDFVFTNTESVADEVGADEASDPGWNVHWPWGNDAIGASWTHLMHGGGTLEVRGSFSRFSAEFNFSGFEGTRMFTEIDQSSLEADLELRPTHTTRWKSGLVGRRLESANLTEGIPPNFQDSEAAGWESGAYTQLSWNASPDWLLDGGVRLDRWESRDGKVIGSVSPRIAIKRFLHDGNLAVRVAGGRYTQFLHSLRDERLPISPDVWVLSGERIPALVSDQVQTGVEAFLGRDEDWYASVEGYHRTYDGAVTQNWAEDPVDPSDDLLSGEASSYGLDLMVRRDMGKTTGWLTLSLLKVSQSFADTDSGRHPPPTIGFPPVFDRRLQIDLGLVRDLGWGVRGGLRWDFGTGLPYTRPLARYEVYRQRQIDLLVERDGTRALVLGPRNGERYPVRHRLDISLRRPIHRDWGSLTPYVNVINVYNRRNVLFYNFDYGPSQPTRSGVSMLPLLPSIGVEASF